jgi:type VI secretion system protein VasG
MLRGLKANYEAAHGVSIRDDAVVAASRLASRYISGRQHPDKGVDLLDTCAALVKIALTSKPSRVEMLEQRIAELERHLAALRRDQSSGVVVPAAAVPEVEKKIEDAKTELAAVEERWNNERARAEKVVELRKKLAQVPPAEEAARKDLRQQLDAALGELARIRGEQPLVPVEVDPQVVAQVISGWTGIPVGSMLKDEARTVLELERRLGERIKGQDHAIRTIAEILRSSKLGLGSPDAPLGVFLLVGPSGVGKTETALGIADQMFGGERFVVTINMSEFQEKHTVSRLIGSPPGYVGYGEGGVLTEAVRQRPYSAVILDEVEKADLEVMNLFYQVFDKGMLSDGEGRLIDFKNTVLLLTSNLGSDVITRLCDGGNRRPEMAEVNEAIRPVLSRHFKPALLARMTVVPYFPISSDAMKGIAQLKLDRLIKRISSAHNVRTNVASEVVDEITRRCTDVESGARNIDHLLRQTLLPEISRVMLEQMAEEKPVETLEIGLADGRITVRAGGA